MNKKIKSEFSSGGVVVNDNKYVLVIKTKNLKGDTVFTFPKGHIENNETAEEAAIREVEEETGVKAKIIEKIKDVEYWFVHKGVKVHKHVSWFLMKPLKIKNIKNIEVDEIIWYDMKDVKKILSYDSDKNLIDEVTKKITTGE